MTHPTPSADEPLSDPVQRDEFGMTEQDWREMRAETRRLERQQRWKCFKALWMKPIPAKRPSQYVIMESSRDYDWTLSRAIRMSIGLLLNLRWTEKHDARNRRKGVKMTFGFDMAFWDNHTTYGGYSVQCGKLYLGFRIEIFEDGDCFL